MVDTAPPGVELTVRLEALACGQILAKQTNLLVLSTLVDPAVGNHAIAKPLQERGDGLRVDAPPGGRQGNPARHRLPVVHRLVRQQFDEAEGQLFVVRSHASISSGARLPALMESPHQDLIIRRCRGPADGSWKDLREPNPWRGIVCQPKGAYANLRKC